MRTPAFWFVLVLALDALASGARAAAVDRTVEVGGGVQIHVVVAGAPSSRAPLVLIPGWTMTTEIWREQIAAFSVDRQVIALDPRSQGASTKTAVGDTPEQRAADLEAVLAKLDLHDLVLVGWSQGGQDVAAYVGRFGTARLKGIVIVDTAVSTGAAAIAKAPDAAAGTFGRMAIYAEQPRAYLAGMMRFIISRPLPAAEMDRIVAASTATPPAIGTAMLVADEFGVDRTPTLAKFDRPTLVIAAATSDELDAQKAMAARIPQGRIEVVAGAAHAVFIDQPERFDALLRGFLAQVETKPAR